MPNNSQRTLVRDICRHGLIATLLPMLLRIQRSLRHEDGRRIGRFLQLHGTFSLYVTLLATLRTDDTRASLLGWCFRPRLLPSPIQYVDTVLLRRGRKELSDHNEDIR